MKKGILLMLFLNLFSGYGAIAQLNINSGLLSPQQLVQTLVGPGIPVTNVTFTGHLPATGSFVDPTGTLGMSNGIVLTSGDPLLIADSNDVFNAGRANNVAGDSLLDTLFNTDTYDATILEFDFVPTTDSFAFSYVFGSEEYNEFVGQGYSDVFAFFVSGPGINGEKNIAVVPGSNTPVMIDSVNNGYANNSTPSVGPCLNCQYYNDNWGGSYIQYDGYTTVLTAGSKVSPCFTYHLRMVIADVGDEIYDSGIFLEAGSFKFTSAFNIQINGTNAPSVTNLCDGECVDLTAPLLPNYLWSNGETTQSITVCTDGQYSITTNTGTCNASSNLIRVEVRPYPAITLSQSNDSIYANVTGGPVTYQWYSGGQPVAGATSSSLALPASGCYSVTATSLFGCSTTSDSLCNYSVSISEAESNKMVQLLSSESGQLVFSRGETIPAEISVYDLTGRLISEQNWQRGASTLSVAVPKTGAVYFLSYRSASGSYNIKFLY